jgi:Ca2+-binding EF-hand superfamily protein
MGGDGLLRGSRFTNTQRFIICKLKVIAMKTFRQFSIFSIGLCTLSLVSLGAVADGGRGHNKFMEYFDSNQDNMVTMSELNEASKQRYAKMDADSNGVVSLEEFQAYLGDRKAQWREQRFTEMDSNADGQVSKEEYILYKQQRAEQRYQEMDADSNGVVSKEEYLNRKRDYRGGNHHGKMHGKHHGGDRFFSKLDSNNDAQLTLEESLAAWTEWFKRIDANNDQVVTADEVNAFRNQMRNN